MSRIYADGLLERRIANISRNIEALKTPQRYKMGQVYTGYVSEEVSQASTNRPIPYLDQPHPMVAVIVKFTGAYVGKTAIARLIDNTEELTLGYMQCPWGIVKPISTTTLAPHELEFLVIVEIFPPGPDTSTLRSSSSVLAKSNLSKISRLSSTQPLSIASVAATSFAHVGFESDTGNPVIRVYGQSTYGYIKLQAYDSDNNAVFDNEDLIHSVSNSDTDIILPFAQYGLPSDTYRIEGAFCDSSGTELTTTETLSIAYTAPDAPLVPDTGGGNCGTDESVPLLTSFTATWYAVANMPGVLTIERSLI